MGGRVVSFGAIEVDRGHAPGPTAQTLGGVTIFGLNELQSAKWRNGDFIEAWRDAICFEIGAEEFEKFCLARRTP